MEKGGQSDDDSEWTSLCSFRKRNMLGIKIVSETDQNTANRLALLRRWNTLKYFYCYHLTRANNHIYIIREKTLQDRKKKSYQLGTLGSFLFIFIFPDFSMGRFQSIVKIYFSYICPVFFF